MNALGLAALTAALVVLGGCATTSGGSSVAVSSVDVIKQQKEIYIGNVSVDFVLEDTRSSNATSPMIRSAGSDYAKASLTAKLDVPESSLQAIADQAYQHLKRDLQAHGYVVRDYQDLIGHTGWQNIEALASPYRPSSAGAFFQKSNSSVVTYAPTGMALLLAQGKGDRIKVADLAEAIGIPVLLAHYTIHFAYFDTDSDYKVNYFKDVPLNGGPSHTLSASVEFGQGIQVVPGSGLEWLTESMSTFADNGAATLDTPVIVSGSYGVNENSTSDAMEAANMFSSLLGAVSGKSSNHQEITVTAVPEYYQFGVLKALDIANHRLMEPLARE